jgi:hypothetical protein
VTLAIDVRHSPRAVALLAVAVLLAACSTGPAASPTPSGASTAIPPASPPAETTAPPATETPAPTEEPPPSDEPTEPPPTTPPTPSPPVTPAPTASGGAAGECTGSDDNRAFYAGVADDVAWDVYCPVLPAGWFVDQGSFRLARGGKMEISYKGPGGARLEIREGAYCAGDAGCIPSGPDAGTASFGGLPARLVDVGGGAWLVVAEGDGVDWEAKGIGMDGPTLAGYTAAFIPVGT